MLYLLGLASGSEQKPKEPFSHLFANIYMKGNLKNKERTSRDQISYFQDFNKSLLPVRLLNTNHLFHIHLKINLFL